MAGGAGATRARGAGSPGQAAIELLAGLPVLLAAALAGLQLLASGYALTLADGAAEAGALAVVAGEPPGAAARAALPGWAEKRVEVGAEEGRVTVELLPPAPLSIFGGRLAVSSSAWARPPRAGRR